MHTALVMQQHIKQQVHDNADAHAQLAAAHNHSSQTAAAVTQAPVSLCVCQQHGTAQRAAQQAAAAQWHVQAGSRAGKPCEAQVHTCKAAA